MPGENRKETLRLDPVVDLALGGLSFLIVTLLGYQWIVVQSRYLSGVRTGLLVAVVAGAALIGLIGRKMRRGQHDLPRLVRVLEVMTIAGLAMFCHLGSPLLTMMISLIPPLLVYEMAYELAHWSEELLFDFAGLALRSNWRQRWETEGYRLYDRHINGFRHLQKLLLAVDGFLILAWLIIVHPGFWGVIGGGMILFLQLIFMGVAFYQKKRIFWAIHGYEVDGRVAKRLLGLVVALALVLSTLAVILPTHYNPIPWKTVGNWLNTLMNGKEYRTTLPSTVVTNEPEKPGVERVQQLIGEMETSWHTWIFLALIGLVVLFFLTVVLGYLLSYWMEERYRLQGLPALLVRIYRFFREMLLGWVKGLRHGLTQMKTEIEHRRERRFQAKLQKRLENANRQSRLEWQPQNEREEIVFLFLQVMEMLHQQGCVRGVTQTLTEYLSVAMEEFPGARDEILTMQKLVEEAVYSLHIFERTHVEIMVTAVAELERQMVRNSSSFESRSQETMTT